MKKESFALSKAVLVIALAATGGLCGAVESDEVFARVGDVEITRAEFEREVYTAARQTYYHGSPPGADAFIDFRRDIADQMIDRELLILEAKRRELQADEAAIDARIASYESRYGDTERWKTDGAEMVASLRARFQEDELLGALEADVRTVPKPDEAAVRLFYEENPDLFTEPERKRVSLILLGVSPSAAGDVWAAATEEAQRILDELESGASFQELARLHSVDATARDGGDMGYLHAGMLSDSAEQAIEELGVGDVSGPVQVLEGIAVFKLTEKTPQELRAFAEVRERAAELWQRQQGDAAWDNLIGDLRSKNDIVVDDEYLVKVPEYVR